MWNGCCVANRNYSYSGNSNCPNRRLTTPTRSFNPNFALLHAGLVRLFSGLVGGLLRGERSALARASKAARASRRLRDEITLKVGNRNHRVIERGGDVRDAHRHILLLFLAKNFFLSSCFSHFENFQILAFRFSEQRQGHYTHSASYFLPGAFFFATVMRLGPLRVRAFVCVRWPRTGSERRCLSPR